MFKKVISHCGLSVSLKNNKNWMNGYVQGVGKGIHYKPIKILLVDYDGVVISRPSSLDLLSRIKKLTSSTYNLTKQRSYDIRKIITAMIRDSPLPLSKVNDYIYLYTKWFNQNNIINEPLISQLKKIKEQFKVKIIVYSNSSKENIRQLPVFDDIRGKEDGDKYSADRLMKTLSSLGASIEETLYIGDSFDDIKPFLDYGMRAVSFYCNPKLFKELNNGWLVSIIKDSVSQGKSDSSQVRSQ